MQAKKQFELADEQYAMSYFIAPNGVFVCVCNVCVYTVVYM